MRRRSPRRHRPWVRVMLVLAHVSSMKIRRAGSRSGWASNHARRSLRTSGLSCSAAWPVFFARHAVTDQEALDRAVPEGEPHPGQLEPQFPDRDVRCRLKHDQDRISVRFDPVRSPVTAQRARAWVALVPRHRSPAAHAGRTDTEALSCSSMRGAGINCRNDTRSKIERKSLGHSDQPPPPVSSMNQKTVPMGIPCDSVRSETALDGLGQCCSD